MPTAKGAHITTDPKTYHPFICIVDLEPIKAAHYRELKTAPSYHTRHI